MGLGQFGRFAAASLASHFDVVGTDSRRTPDSDEPGIRRVSLAEAAASAVVVLAVPVQALPRVLDEISPHLRENALVVDVCSVKVAPVRWMLDRLPSHVEVVGTHPLFGPQSAADGLAGHTVVVCPARTSRKREVCEFLAGLGLEVIVTDPDTHDRQVAYTQALAQYVGRGVHGLQGEELMMATPAAEKLREVARIVGGDTEELFVAIQGLNPYALTMRNHLRQQLDELDRIIDDATEGDR